MSAVCQNQPSLNTTLTQYADNNDLKFSFDVDLMNKILTPSFGDISKDSLFSYLQSVYPIAIQQIDNNYYTISLSEVRYQVLMMDSISNEPIIPEISSVLINGKAIPSKVSNQKLVFNYKPTTDDTLAIYAPGYEVFTIGYIDLLNQRELTTFFTPNYKELNTIIIKDFITEGIDLNPSNQSININVSALPLLPGETDGDIFASLSALPGISTPDNRAGNLFIRGSSTDQSYTMLDNIPIYSRGHYFGTISPYNPKVVDKVEVHRNGFHPRLGGRVGGAIEIKTDNEASTETSGGIGLNTLFAMGYVKTPVFNDKAGLNIGLRRSFPTSFASPKLKAITQMVYAGSAVADVNTGKIITDVDVIFEDYQLSINVPFSKKDNLHFSSLYTSSQITYQIERDNNESIPEKTSYNNLGFSTSWNRTFSQSLQSNLTLSPFTEFL